MRILLKTLATLPMSVWTAYAIKIYWLLRFTGYRSSVIEQNLKRSFPSKNDKELKKINNRFYRHLAQYFVEVLKMFALNPAFIQQRVKLKNQELIHRYYQEGKDVILVLGHYGNWEWGLLATSIMSSHEMVGIYKPLSSNFWNDRIKKVRSQFGATLISKKESIRYLLKKGDKPRLIGVIGDQTPTKNEIDYWTTFLNQETPVFSGTEKLAKKLNCPVVFVHIDKIKNGYYEMSFELITEKPQAHPEEEITTLHTQKLEEKIIARPELWLWSHRRWKHSRK